MRRTNARAGNRRGYYSRYIAHYTKKHYGLLVFGFLFLVGVTLGTFLVRYITKETLEYMLRMVNGYVHNRQEQSLLQNFTSGVFASMIFLGILFFSGFCAIAQPVIVLMPLFRGLGVGFSLASLYASQGTEAIGYVLLLMLPGTVISSLVILVCSQESMRMANALFSTMTKDRQETIPYSPRLYIARYVICVLLCIIAAFIEAVFYFAFAHFFVIG